MDQFDCNICFEGYQSSGGHQPCVIDCGHTLCLDCVNKLKSFRNAARCPFCKSPISCQRTFPKNYSLLDTMAMLLEQQQLISPNSTALANEPTEGITQVSHPRHEHSPKVSF
jgi:hypothetical protein